MMKQQSLIVAGIAVLAVGCGDGSGQLGPAQAEPQYNLDGSEIEQVELFEPQLILTKDSRAITPTSAKRLQTAEGNHIGRDRPWNLRMVGSGGGMRLRFYPFADVSKLVVVQLPSTRQVAFQIADSYYQMNNDERIPLVGKRVYPRNYTGGEPTPQLNFDLPTSLAELLPYNAPRLSTESEQRIRAMSGDVHRFHIAFQIDGEAYALEAGFEIVLKSRYAAPP